MTHRLEKLLFVKRLLTKLQTSVLIKELPTKPGILSGNRSPKGSGLPAEEYFLGKRKVFGLPLNLTGTKFMKAVWEALLTIPYGETRSYKEIAQMIGNPNACRAVGQANNKNPISIIVPCHRVIGSDGNLVGYGAGLEIKEYLLDFERRHK